MREHPEKVLTSSVEGVVIRPSVVVSLRGSYGGSSLLRSLAALPCVVFLPGDGSQTIQPVLLDDLASIVVESVEQPRMCQRLLYAVGPEIITLKALILATRRWLGFSNPRVITIPLKLVQLVVKAGQYIGYGPLGETVYSLLNRGNVATVSEYEKISEVLNISSDNVIHALESEASYVQDRWHARLYLLRPLVILFLAFVWVASGLVGLVTPLENFKPVLDTIGVPVGWQYPLVLTTGWGDIVLGIGFLVGSLRSRFILLMLIATLSYTLILGFLAPQFWFEPLGGLLKNLIIFPLLLICWTINDLR